MAFTSGAHRCQRPAATLCPCGLAARAERPSARPPPTSGFTNPRSSPTYRLGTRHPGPDPPDSSRSSALRVLRRSPPGLEHGTEIYRRVAPLHAATQVAVAIETEVAAFDSTVATTRRADMRTRMASVASKNELRAGLDVDHAIEIHYLLHSHQAYLGLVVGADWSIPEYKPGSTTFFVNSSLPHGPRSHHARCDRNVTQHRARERTRVRPVPVDGLGFRGVVEK
jgi:hypothetical protein